MPQDTNYIIKDFKEIYGTIMQFNKNKTAFVHQWYPFVEGYSREFINNIIEEIDYTPEFALDPFAGSGTTPVELQNMGVNCYSFEVSPFMHLLASVKLEIGYKSDDFIENYDIVTDFLNGRLVQIRKRISPPLAKTFQPREGKDKWIFNLTVMDGILDIKYAISLLGDERYKKLFKIALASILLEISNVYRNGKCLSYKKDWKEKTILRRDIHKIFLDKLSLLIQPDIEKLQNNRPLVKNSNLCFYGDVRNNISSIPDNTIDLIITSPPYLNSRDYTDIYIAELWILDLVKNYEDIKLLRSKTFRSHVQIKLGQIELLNIPELVRVIEKLDLKKDQFWNSELSEMVKAYFVDIDILFNEFKKKMRSNRKIFFNVANSAYYGIEIKVDEIVCAIAEKNGFLVNEIREARQLKPSTQQKDSIKSLRESVIVITSP